MSDEQDMAAGGKAAEEIAKALRLPRRVIRAEIKLEPHSPPVVAVEMLIGIDEANDLVTALKRYKLVEDGGNDE